MDSNGNDVDQCCICLESLEADGLGRQWLSCGHATHKLCIAELRRRGASGRCPLCRESIADLTPVQVLLERAAVHSQRREYEQEVKCLEEVLSVEPSSAYALIALGGCFLGVRGVARDDARAAELFEEARRGGRVDATVHLGVLYMKQGNLPKARELLEEEHAVGSTYAAYGLGLLYKIKGDLQMDSLPGPPDACR